MQKALLALSAALVFLVSACGGGADSAAPAFADGSHPVAAAAQPQILIPQGTPKAPLAVAAQAPTPDQVMDWGEQHFPQYFPPHQATGVFGPYQYRYYAQTNIYLAVNGNLVQIFGAETFGPNIVTVGTLADFTCLVFTCQVPPPPAPPTANAGQDSTVYTNTTALLQGSGTDPAGAPLTYLWTLVSRPQGSITQLGNPQAAVTTFTPDVPGNYVFSLVVSNGSTSSAASTVTFLALNYLIGYQ